MKKCHLLYNKWTWQPCTEYSFELSFHEKWNISCHTDQDTLDSLLHGNSFFTDQHKSFFCVFRALIVCWLCYVLQAEGLCTFGCKKLFQSIRMSWKAYLLSTDWPNAFFSHSVPLYQIPDIFLFNDSLWMIAVCWFRYTRKESFYWRSNSEAPGIQQKLARHVTNIYFLEQFHTESTFNILGFVLPSDATSNNC